MKKQNIFLIIFIGTIIILSLLFSLRNYWLVNIYQPKEVINLKEYTNKMTIEEKAEYLCNQYSSSCNIEGYSQSGNRISYIDYDAGCGKSPDCIVGTCYDDTQKCEWLIQSGILIGTVYLI